MDPPDLVESEPNVQAPSDDIDAAKIREMLDFGGCDDDEVMELMTDGAQAGAQDSQMIAEIAEGMLGEELPEGVLEQEMLDAAMQGLEAGQMRLQGSFQGTATTATHQLDLAVGLDVEMPSEVAAEAMRQLGARSRSCSPAPALTQHANEDFPLPGRQPRSTLFSKLADFFHRDAREANQPAAGQLALPDLTLKIEDAKAIQQENRTLATDLHDCRAQVSHLEKLLADTMQERESLKNQVMLLAEEQAEQSLHIDSIRFQSQLCMESTGASNTLLAEREEELRAAESLAGELTREKEALTSSLAKETSVRQHLEGQLGASKAGAEVLLEETRSLKRELHDLRARSADLEAQVQNLQEDRDSAAQASGSDSLLLQSELEDRLQSLTVERDELLLRLQTVSSHADAAVVAQARVAELEIQVGDLAAKRAGAEARAEQAEIIISERQGETDGLHGELEALREELRQSVANAIAAGRVAAAEAAKAQELASNLAFEASAAAEAKAMAAQKEIEIEQAMSRLAALEQQARESSRAAATGAPTEPPPGEKAAEALARLQRDLGDATRICILGGTAIQNADSEALVKAIAEGLPASLGNRATFITCGMAGVQRTFATYCSDASRLWNVLPIGESSGYGVGMDIHAGADTEERRQIFRQLGDIYITVEGGPTVSQDVKVVVARGAEVIPLARSGGASAGMFDFPRKALDSPAWAPKDRWASLSNNKETVEDSARALIEIAASFVAARSSANDPNVEQLRLENERLKERCSTLQAGSEKLKGERASLQSYRDRYNSLQAEYQQVVQARESLQGEKHGLDSETSRLRAEVRSLRREMDKFKQEQAAAVAAKAKSDAAVARAEEQNAKLQKSNSELTAKLGSHSAREAQAKSRAEELSQNLSKAEARLKGNDSASSLALKEKELSRLRAQLKIAEEAATSARAQHRQILDKSEDARSEASELQLKCMELEAKAASAMKDVEERVEAAEKRVSSAQEDAQKYLDERDKARKELREARNSGLGEQNKTQEELCSLRQAELRSQMQIQAQEQEIAQLQAVLQAAHSAAVDPLNSSTRQGTSVLWQDASGDCLVRTVPAVSAQHGPKMTYIGTTTSTRVMGSATANASFVGSPGASANVPVASAMPRAPVMTTVSPVPTGSLKFGAAPATTPAPSFIAAPGPVPTATTLSSVRMPVPTLTVKQRPSAQQLIQVRQTMPQRRVRVLQTPAGPIRATMNVQIKGIRRIQRSSVPPVVVTPTSPPTTAFDTDHMSI